MLDRGVGHSGRRAEPGPLPVAELVALEVGQDELGAGRAAGREIPLGESPPEPRREGTRRERPLSVPFVW